MKLYMKGFNNKKGFDHETIRMVSTMKLYIKGFDHETIYERFQP